MKTIGIKNALIKRFKIGRQICSPERVFESSLPPHSLYHSMAQ